MVLHHAHKQAELLTSVLEWPGTRMVSTPCLLSSTPILRYNSLTPASKEAREAQARREEDKRAAETEAREARREEAEREEAERAAAEVQ